MAEVEAFELKVIAVQDQLGATTLNVSGELDVSTTATLRAEVQRLDLDGGIALRFDLSGLTFIDSTGLGTIVATARRVRSAGGTFSTKCSAGSVRQLFETTGLVEYLDVETVDACSSSDSAGN